MTRSSVISWWSIARPTCLAPTTTTVQTSAAIRRYRIMASSFPECGGSALPPAHACGMRGLWGTWGCGASRDGLLVDVPDDLEIGEQGFVACDVALEDHAPLRVSCSCKLCAVVLQTGLRVGDALHG